MSILLTDEPAAAFRSSDGADTDQKDYGLIAGLSVLAVIVVLIIVIVVYVAVRRRKRDFKLQ